MSRLDIENSEKLHFRGDPPKISDDGMISRLARRDDPSKEKNELYADLYYHIKDELPRVHHLLGNQYQYYFVYCVVRDVKHHIQIRVI